MVLYHTQALAVEENSSSEDDFMKILSRVPSIIDISLPRIHIPAQSTRYPFTDNAVALFSQYSEISE